MRTRLVPAHPLPLAGSAAEAVGEQVMLRITIHRREQLAGLETGLIWQRTSDAPNRFLFWGNFGIKYGITVAPVLDFSRCDGQEGGVQCLIF